MSSTKDRQEESGIQNDRSDPTTYRSVQNTVLGYADTDGYTLVSRRYNKNRNGHKTGCLNKSGRTGEGRRSDNGYSEGNGKRREERKNIKTSKSSLY
jgi:hypothetical protein